MTGPDSRRPTVKATVAAPTHATLADQRSVRLRDTLRSDLREVRAMLHGYDEAITIAWPAGVSRTG